MPNNPINYVASSKAYRKHKANVTRLRNKKEWAKVITECELAFEDFDRYGWVDNWALFMREAEDALYKLARAEAPDYKTWSIKVYEMRNR